MAQLKASFQVSQLPSTTVGPDNTIVVNPHGAHSSLDVCFKNPAPLFPLKVTQVLPVHAECCTVSIQACVYQMNETTTDIAMALTSRPLPPAFTPRLLLRFVMRAKITFTSTTDTHRQGGKKKRKEEEEKKKKRAQVDGAVIAQFTTASRRDRRRE